METSAYSCELALGGIYERIRKTIKSFGKRKKA